MKKKSFVFLYNINTLSIFYEVGFDNVCVRVGRATNDLFDVKCPKFSFNKICKR